MTKTTTVVEKEGFTLLTLYEPINRESFPNNIELPDVKPNLGLIISGDLPDWLYFYIGNFYQNKCQWLAIDDPHLGGAVVVVSHTPGVNIGDLVPLSGKF